MDGRAAGDRSSASTGATPPRPTSGGWEISCAGGCFAGQFTANVGGGGGTEPKASLAGLKTPFAPAGTLNDLKGSTIGISISEPGSPQDLDRHGLLVEMRDEVPMLRLLHLQAPTKIALATRTQNAL